ncbi:MAG: pyridoxine 5'-phosphate synthase [bacterium]|nr:pyridoxine 5'-phosphate synthase [bacterium]
MATLGVNIDHVATVRQARGVGEPDPIAAAVLAELAGCHGITVHLREDRRHIQERDVTILRKVVQTKLNLEMAATTEMVALAQDLLPDQATLVPEKREELTTEGGLDVITHQESITKAVESLSQAGIKVSLFIDPVLDQIEAASKTGAPFIELHTGEYAGAKSEEEVERELARLKKAAAKAVTLGLRINAGHGLNYRNVTPVASIPRVEELNIGHSIVSRAVLVGMERAVREMLVLI